MRAVALLVVLLSTGVAGAEGVGGRLLGRVFERGSFVPIAGATVATSTGASATSGDDGRFAIDLPPGAVELAISTERYEVLRVVERIVAGQALAVDYGLTPLPAYRSRYRTVVQGEARHEGQRFTLRDEELQKMPGGLGDPFRVVGTLPGVATPLTLLPVYVVRGASPGMNGFFLDGMRVPQLFHFMVGGGVVHPRLVDHLDFYPGAYDASFGRFGGGIIDTTTRPARTDAPAHGEVELRIYEDTAYVETHYKDLAVEAAGHVGYPTFLIHLFDTRVSVVYWDYQLRADWRGLTLEVLGSHDSLTFLREPNVVAGNVVTMGARFPDEFRITYHRAQLRDVVRRGGFELETALVGSIDDFQVFGGQGLRKLAVGARAIARFQSRRLRLQAGVDGELSRFTAQNFAANVPRAAPDQLGDLYGDRDGAVAGGFLQGTLRLDDLVGRPLAITLGARVDTYHAGVVTLLGVDPRLQVRLTLVDGLELDAGVGLYQQPPSAPVALPGIDTFALQLGLQRAWQGAVGVRARLPGAFSLSLTGYYEFFYNINDPLTDFSAVACTSPPPESLTGVPAQLTRQIDGRSFGAELLLRREAGRLTGWIAYTLSRGERFYSCGLRPSDWDQTHVLNVVVQLRLPWRMMAGARVLYSTGRPFTHLLREGGMVVAPIRNNDRLPGFFELDLRVDREWLFDRWALSAFVEALNVTYSESIFGVQYPVVSGITRYDRPSPDGFQWVLPSVGLRGRF